jgi:hypothetical protein
MSYLNIFIGLGGTGVEVINDLLKIVNRYPLKNNKYECFVLDTADLDTKFSYIKEREKTVFKKLPGFNSSKDVIQQIKSEYPESNIDEIFPPNTDYLATHIESSQGGSFENRKLGFLVFLYYLYSSSNNIFNIINSCLDRYSSPPNPVIGVNIFIINSIAGGTGSGFFIPFINFLKYTMDNGFLSSHPNYKLFYYNFLAFPSFLAKGSRKPSELKDIKYKANAYEAILELKKLMSNEIKWNVKINSQKEFDFSDGGTDFIKSFIVYHDINLAKSSVPINDVPNVELYKPNFQEMAWCLYFLGCADPAYWDQANNIFKQFSGMGVLPIEFPTDTLINNISSELFKKTSVSYEIFFNKSLEDIKKQVGTFTPSFFEFVSRSKAELLNNQIKDYRVELSKIKLVDELKRKDPIIVKYEVHAFFEKYKSELNDKILELLIGDYTLKDIYYYFKFFKEKIKIDYGNCEYKKYADKLEVINNSIKNIKNDINELKNVNKLKDKQLSLLSNSFEKAHIEGYLNLLDTIATDLQKKMDYFWAIREIFTDDSLLDKYSLSDDYFKFSPPFSTIGYDSNNFKEIQIKIIKDIFKENISTSLKHSEIEYAEKEILKIIWLEYSKTKLNNFIKDDYKKRFASSFEESFDNIKSEISQQLYSEWYSTIQKYFKTTSYSFIDKYCKVDKFKEISKDFISVCYPYIPISSSDKQVQLSAVFSSEKRKNLLSINFDDQTPNEYYVLDNNNLIIISSIKGDVPLENLQLDDLKKCYEEKRKEDSKVEPSKRRFTFIDPRFGDNK